MSEEWGPWIEHDGRGCPCIGEWAEVEVATLPDRKVSYRKQARIKGGPQWWWENAKTVTRETEQFLFVIGGVIRYRVRRPRALEQLREIAANPTAPLPKRRPNREFA